MKIRILKLPPAPMMDGHDVRAYRSAVIGKVYDEDLELAEYLIAAEYAVPEPSERAEDSGQQSARRAR
jgi:hypothetical protein